MQRTERHQVPFMEVTFYSRQYVMPTPMSDVLWQNSVVGEHAHQWVFVHGSGNGIACALGQGDIQFQHVYNASYARLVSQLMNPLQPSQRVTLARRVLAPDTCDETAMQLDEIGMASDGGRDSEAVKKWVDDHAGSISTLLSSPVSNMDGK